MVTARCPNKVKEEAFFIDIGVLRAFWLSMGGTAAGETAQKGNTKTRSHEDGFVSLRVLRDFV